MEFSKEALEAAVQAAVHHAHIGMSEEAFLACQQEMEFITGWAKELEALALEDTPMTISVNLPGTCPTRPDELSPSMGSKEALAQAPVKMGSCFVVPQIIE
ncbi:MAG: aspartyl/glutamyl-tRNA amidotransferase subunit C [Cystobacterineae bacterium]|nr:aspartyl/glutamyl-tRNA amidotransferase subunit C [Cystobacterineae bacterium]